MNVLYTLVVTMVLLLLSVSTLTLVLGDQATKKMIGVVDFADSKSHLISSTFSNFFFPGDVVKLHGYVLDTNDWYKPLFAHANVIVRGPDGLVIFQKDDISTDKNNEFYIDVTIPNDSKIGKYVVTVEPVKEGYEKLDTQYLAAFYVMRKNDFAIYYNDTSYPVTVSSIQFQSSYMKYNQTRHALTFDIQSIPGNYTSDIDLGYPDRQVWVLMKKPLAFGGFQEISDTYGMNGWPYWQQNATYSMVQLSVPNASEKIVTTLVGTGPP